MGKTTTNDYVDTDFSNFDQVYILIRDFTIYSLIASFASMCLCWTSLVFYEAIIFTILTVLISWTTGLIAIVGFFNHLLWRNKK